MQIRLLRSRPAPVSSLLLICIPFTLLSQTAFAQAGQSEVTGAVTDESGAGVAGASVALSEVGSNAPAVIASGDDGVYTATNLRPGVYVLTVEARGFRRLRREGV